jgi:hypothetical protein
LVYSTRPGRRRSTDGAALVSATGWSGLSGPAWGGFTQRR